MAADVRAPTSAKPTLGELLLGIEGLALLRLAFGDDAEARRARVSEIRTLMSELEATPELAASLAAPEYDLSEGSGLACGRDAAVDLGRD